MELRVTDEPCFKIGDSCKNKFYIFFFICKGKSLVGLTSYPQKKKEKPFYFGAFCSRFIVSLDNN